MGKLSLYWHTAKHLKSEQVIYRVTDRLGLECSLGVKPCMDAHDGPIALLPQLDFDPSFLSRFPVAELMDDRITLLHESEDFLWDSRWKFDHRTPLWNYNLHYFEYLFPLIHGWRQTNQPCYLQKIQEMICGWIRQNPRAAGGAGWDSYPISLRLINWLSCYGYLKDHWDEDFKRMLIDSMKEQYAHLAVHLEKRLLGNHYFENLKTLVICSIFFRDHAMTAAALRELKKQCAEQILADGMHFELSLMYHKIILEDLMRTATTLRLADCTDAELEQYLQPMVDAAYSLEEGLERIPLFNDCGDNVAKSLDALLLAAKEAFHIEPQYKSQLPDGGYYMFKSGDWKLIVDAGRAGPDYLLGHAHCDAMSFELFYKGAPVLVNCGTYAYQCQERNFFRSTAAHNTVMCNGVEQSQYWGNFRMAKRAKITVVRADQTSIVMNLRDQAGNQVTRTICMDSDGFHIRDFCAAGKLQAYVHCAGDLTQEGDLWHVQGYPITVSCEGQTALRAMAYAPEFGRKDRISTILIENHESVSCKIAFVDGP